jgi:hypothetical protein
VEGRVAVGVFQVDVGTKCYRDFDCWQMARNAREVERGFLVAHSLVDIAAVLD